MNCHELQNSLYQNAAMGITALKEVIPSVNNSEMKKILLKQYNGYKHTTEMTASQMKRENTTPSFPPVTSRLMTKAMINLKLRKDSSSHNVAKMLIEGTNTGIMELTEKLNRTDDKSSGAAKTAKEYLRREQSYIESLKPYL